MFSEDYRDRPIDPPEPEPDLFICEVCSVEYGPQESDAEDYQHFCSAECEGSECEEDE